MAELGINDPFESTAGSSNVVVRAHPDHEHFFDEGYAGESGPHGCIVVPPFLSRSIADLLRL
ncbi:hypothetical protein GGF31_003885 [Allomyces arbusculus]|nr:hypothetical protein GGF31_003885 [Allomyces arbusculus]